MTQLSMLEVETPQPRRRPSEPIIREAVIDGEYRYLAKRAWGSGPCILWAMTNPSIADGTRDDPTMWRVIDFSYGWGFGSAIIVNIYPFVTPSMKALERWRSVAVAVDEGFDGPRLAMQRNIHTISEQMNHCTKFMAAWGNDVHLIDFEKFMDRARLRLPADEETGDPSILVSVDWHCLGTNKDGSPRHPLARGRNRVPNDFEPVIWRRAA